MGCLGSVEARCIGLAYIKEGNDEISHGFISYGVVRGLLHWSLLAPSFSTSSCNNLRSGGHGGRRLVRM